ncbi:major facilitator superfamily transporter [Diaporthe amygdali]|uniref:major facilitator superfamily transporter n=1 Tax=Phomopsis amygdali TaxID=1214568 RepID=UPI0022FEA146|nr:major facilitator superfamily transporter [Diaporthe amygdali]KAJ0115548.1 major facilitator superfamily transporter [Diaporthe amygdali]
MSFTTTPQTGATPHIPAISEADAQPSSEPSTRSSSPPLNLNVDSRRSEQAMPGNTFWAEPLYFEYSPSITPDSSPPYTRQTSVVDLGVLKQEPYITSKPKPIHEPEELYHVFSRSKKWAIVILIGIAGLFSGLSSNIYFPALDAIAKDFHVSLQAVSLTITSYLICQAISPVIWGSLADALGRRPIYMASFGVYIVANIALSFAPNYAVLLVFRGLQAVGSASTVSIGNGVIQDITPSSERGSFISFYQAVRNFSIAVGPVLGGALSNYLGFHAIFVFLWILSSLTIVSLVLFLPETMRSIAGNGTVRLGGIYRPLIECFGVKPKYYEQDAPKGASRMKVDLATFISPLKLLVQRDILTNLIFGGVVYAIWSMVTSSTTGLFKDRFHLDETMIGLAYLPNGIGTIVGSAIVAKLMTRDFRVYENTYRSDNGLPMDYTIPTKAIPAGFPIEHARLRNLWWIVALFVASVTGYGFSMSVSRSVSNRPGYIAVPLALQFIIAATSNAVFAANQTLVSDLCPGKGASATAINNLVRCTLGAVGVAVVDAMIEKLGPGYTFLALAIVMACCTPLAVLTWVFGQRWREERTTKTID